ncbi:class I SAM-dependent methyltransferase [Methanolobus psychrotolerans]|uniref:class I SAM-dependent methyltransferase n=1 Tax=Methanolobus psychrotolerans TaxID=1874706 RepID=UPI000B91BCCE|nr:class I SAM-dependent methyltransferase [Methanolobus psychrotolerans]
MKELPDWYYDEFIQKGTDYTSEEEIQNYDRKMRTIRNIAEEAETMIKLIDLRPDHNVLEIGCGTGEFSIELSRYCKQVLALDISQGMLEFAREKSITRGRDNIDFTKAGFLTFEPKGKEFDAVVTQLVLHHLPDFWKLIALRNVNSMLKPGGKFYLKDVVFSSDTRDFDFYFSQVFQKMPPEAGDEIINEMKLHIKEEFSTFDWVMEGLIEKAGFRIEQSQYQNGFMATYLCIKK